MKYFLFASPLCLLLLLGCAAPKTNSSEAREALEKKYSSKVGSAKKQDLVEHFGQPEWCHPDSGSGETCRFYQKIGTNWVGQGKRDKKSYEAFDELVTVFDSQGVLREIKANAQR